MSMNNFELLTDCQIPEINNRARLYRHIKTGAQLLSMENDDENKFFGIAFATPPPDATGIAHIMEHSVLCGSRKYPVKSPFAELIKGSLATFLGAYTTADKTCYPAASQNVQDFYNLIDVYLDMVLYPQITPETLMQEGWHYELDSPDGIMTMNGVVFNEERGAYTSPDRLHRQRIQQSLFPDTAYGVDAGGDPRCIPQLTYAQFKRFHETYYHPSNSFIFFYGNDDPLKRLEVVQGYLKDFDRRDIDSRVGLQSSFTEPRRLSYGYDAGEEVAGVREKGMVSVNWLLAERCDIEAALAQTILTHILMGTPASPLRKALMDSAIGGDIIGNPEDELGIHDKRQLTFSAGLKGVAQDDALMVEDVILNTLARLARDGIEREMVEASLNTIEFRLRENNAGRFPRGLALMQRALATWLYGHDPTIGLAFAAPLEAIKQKVASDRRFFETLIEQAFLTNPHRTTVLLNPDPELRAQIAAEERARLDQVRAAMTDADVQRLIEETRRLKEKQVEPDSPEALATIPRLRLSDLEKLDRRIPLETLELQGVKVLVHDLFTHGITYLDVGFNLHTLPQEYLPYATLFGRALLGLGTDTEDYAGLTRRIGRVTGGISSATLTTAVRRSDEAAAWLFLRAKAMVAQTGDLIALLKDVLLTARLDNRERFRQIVLEEKEGQEAVLLPEGHRIVDTRLRARFTQSEWANEQLSGLTYLFFLRTLIEQVDQDWAGVLGKLEIVRSCLINRSSMLVNVTLDHANTQSILPIVSDFLRQLPDRPVSMAVWTPVVPAQPEGLTAPSPVNYISKGANLYKLGYKLHGSALVICNLLYTTWIWKCIHAQGGAYSAFPYFNNDTGTFSNVSYRDPNLLATLDNFDKSADFLRELDLNEDELIKAIIGAIGGLDYYQLPDEKGFTSLTRAVAGDTEEARQRLRDQALATTVADVKAFADMLDLVKQYGQVVVMGSDQAINAAKAERQLGMQVIGMSGAP